MKACLLVNSGIEDVAELELKEFLGSNKKIKSFANVLEFELKDKQELLDLSKKIQSARRLLISLGKTKKVDDFEFDGKIVWKELLPKEINFKVEVEGVKGNENRLEIAKKIAGKFYSSLEEDKSENKIEATIDLKNPKLLLVVFFNGKEYFIGFDDNIKELNLRTYRLFPHQASFKGDLAYYFLRKSQYNPQNDNLLLGFCKDGIVAIEAALFAKNLENKKDKNETKRILAVDESTQNIIAAKKNAKLAKIEDSLEIKKMDVDELDVKFSEKEFDCLIFLVTSKDEKKLNELYYQSSYILKSKGKLMLISRKDWELSVSNKFKLLEKKEIIKGESTYKYHLMERK